MPDPRTFEVEPDPSVFPPLAQLCALPSVCLLTLLFPRCLCFPAACATLHTTFCFPTTSVFPPLAQLCVPPSVFPLCLLLPLCLALPLHLALPLRLVLPLHLALPLRLALPSASPHLHLASLRFTSPAKPSQAPNKI
ncbi:hypothetical protein B0H13DRAFT_2331965 [Mycena leptocephala]|nr:hypothetical protein B0H13DRAFT_2331965 [Mycena leptocephala]